MFCQMKGKNNILKKLDHFWLQTVLMYSTFQCDAPYRGHPTNFFLQVSQSG